MAPEVAGCDSMRVLVDDADRAAAESLALLVQLWGHDVRAVRGRRRGSPFSRGGGGRSEVKLGPQEGGVMRFFAVIGGVVAIVCGCSFILFTLPPAFVQPRSARGVGYCL